MYDRAVELSKQLGVYERIVFFNDHWVKYEERQNYLLESDIGICGHYDTIETVFSYRTRILDYIWADLPIITSRGDEMAEIVEEFEIGEVVDIEDVESVKDAIIKMTLPEQRNIYKKNMKKISDRYKWKNLINPILNFCEQPHKLNGYRRDVRPENDMGRQHHPKTIEGRLEALEESAQKIHFFIERINRFILFRIYNKLRRHYH